MKIMKLYQLFGVGLTLLTFNMPAIAVEDEHTYPGALCQPSSNTQAILRDSLGRMFNNSSAPQIWICPIARDSVLAEEIEFARITVIDGNNNSSGGVLSCTLHSRTDVAGFFASATNSTTALQVGVVKLDYGAGDPNAVNGAPNGYYYFRCSIPGIDSGFSGVVSYHINENVGEN